MAGGIGLWRVAHDGVPEVRDCAQCTVGKDEGKKGGFGGVMLQLVAIDDQGWPRIVLEQLDDGDRIQQPQSIAMFANVGRGGRRRAGPLRRSSARDAGLRGRALAAEGAAGQGDGTDAAVLPRITKHARRRLGAGEARRQAGTGGARGEEERRQWLAVGAGARERVQGQGRVVERSRALRRP